MDAAESVGGELQATIGENDGTRTTCYDKRCGSKHLQRSPQHVVWPKPSRVPQNEEKITNFG